MEIDQPEKNIASGFISGEHGNRPTRKKMAYMYIDQFIVLTLVSILLKQQYQCSILSSVVNTCKLLLLNIKLGKVVLLEFEKKKKPTPIHILPHQENYTHSY